MVKPDTPTEPPFVGRNQVMANLTLGIAQAKIARPTAMVVQGERGIGKSRVLREFAAEQLRQDGVLVLTGAWQVDSGETRGGLFNALEQLPRVLARLEPDERDDIRRQIVSATKHLGAIVARSAPALGSVLRQAEELPQIELGGDFSRHAAVIADVLKAIGTRQRPLLLILDNIEEMDANSAAILDIVTQTHPAHYTLLIMGMRSGAGTYQPSFEHEAIELTPLALPETRDLLEQALPGPIEQVDEIAQALLEISEGLPLSLGATLRSWLEQGELSRGADEIWRAEERLLGGTGTANVRELFAARLVGLSDETKQIAVLIAVFGVVVKASYIEEITGGSDAVISDLCERGLLVRTGVGVRFPHDTIRALVVESFDDAQLRDAHRVAAEILTRQGAPIPQIVYHRDHGFDPDNETPDESDKLSRLHVEAGRDCLDIYDLGRARWHLERALDHSRDPEQRAVAAEALADICLLQEDLDMAVSLYTALIATSEPVAAVSVAAKVAQFLYGKNAGHEAQQLGAMALEVAHEPTPSTPIGKIGVILQSLLRAAFNRETGHSPEMRDALCRLYMWMFYISLIDNPLSVVMYTMRARWVGKELRTGSAAMIRSAEAALATVLGFIEYADRVFKWCAEVAVESRDAWAQGMVYHHWGGALLASARYSDGQDRLDDGIAAFRETGDVTISMISMLEKAIYGRDREHSDRVLGWIDEALSTGRRNGKRAAGLPLRSMKLYILARQGHPDLAERLRDQAEANINDVATPMEKLTAQVQLAYACLESDELELAMNQVEASQKLAEEMSGGVPEWCQEVNLVAALALLKRPVRSRSDAKKLRRVVRKFKKAIKRLPRLKVFRDLLDMKLMLDAGRFDRAQALAKTITAEFDTHQNLNATRQAHLTLARLLEGPEVLKAAEHDRLARRLGRALGLSEHVLLSDFSEIGRELGEYTLAEEPDFQETSAHRTVSGAGMLTPAMTAPVAKPASEGDELDNPGDDALMVWMNPTDAPRSATLGAIIEPVRAAGGARLTPGKLRIECSNPGLLVPVDAADLEILTITLIGAVGDAVTQDSEITVHLEETHYSDRHVPGVGRSIPTGRYLLTHVIGRGSWTYTPVIGAFSNCERQAQSLGGYLSAVTERGRVELLAYVPLDDEPQFDTAPTSSPGDGPRRVTVIHPDAATRESLALVLTELSIVHEVLAPAQFDINAADDLGLILADAGTLEDVRHLQPLWAPRLVELVKRGDDSALDYEFEIFYYPFSPSDLTDLLENQ